MRRGKPSRKVVKERIVRRRNDRQQILVKANEPATKGKADVRYKFESLRPGRGCTTTKTSA